MSCKAPLVTTHVLGGVLGFPGIVMFGLLASVGMGLAVARTDVPKFMVAEGAMSAMLSGSAGWPELTVTDGCAKHEGHAPLTGATRNGPDPTMSSGLVC